MSWARRHVPEPEKGTSAAAATARAEGGRALDVPLLPPFPFQKTGGKKKKKSQNDMPMKESATCLEILIQGMF